MPPEVLYKNTDLVGSTSLVALSLWSVPVDSSAGCYVSLSLPLCGAHPLCPLPKLTRVDEPWSSYLVLAVLTGSPCSAPHSVPLRKCAGARAELLVELRSSSALIGQRHPQAFVRGVIGISHWSRGIVVLEEGHGSL